MVAMVDDEEDDGVGTVALQDAEESANGRTSEATKAGQGA